METDGKRTRIEMRKVDPDRSPDAKKIRAHEAKNNQNNDWSKKSAKGLSKIQGRWTNPVKISQPWSTGEQRRSGDAQGGVDIRFTQESEIQRPSNNFMSSNQLEIAVEAKFSAMEGRMKKAVHV